MSDLEGALMRTVARHLGHAVPIRMTSSLSSDPERAIGIVTIKIVTEEHVQAIAFGEFDVPPTVVTRLNPIGRDVADLMPFAIFLARVADGVVAGEREPRIWMPHESTLETIDLLGHRYWTNSEAPAEIVRMGQLCRVIGHEATIPGQQLVANASEVLRDHVTTGQTPIEDGHLGALLAWLDRTCRDPLRVGRERIRIPASGVLPNTPDQRDDDYVDSLRKIAKNSAGARRESANRAINAILHRAVMREWQLLVEARDAFHGLHMPALGLEALAKDSKKRVRDGFANGHYPARRADDLAKELDIMETGQELAEQAALENDISWRERARRAGRAILGTITIVDQPKPRHHPCSIIIDTTQGVVRPRRDDKVKFVGTKVTGFVRGIDVNPNGGTRLTIEIENGVQSTILSVGTQVEIINRSFGFVPFQSYAIARTRQPWHFYGRDIPVLAASARPAQSAKDIARARRKT